MGKTMKLRRKITKILDTNFPDDMDMGMYHPNLSPALDAILAAVREEVEGMKKNVTDDSSGYYREALSDVLEKLK